MESKFTMYIYVTIDLIIFNQMKCIIKHHLDANTVKFVDYDLKSICFHRQSRNVSIINNIEASDNKSCFSFQTCAYII